MYQPPYLLIHGLIGSLQNLLPVFAAQKIAAYAPDLLGYGALQNVDPALITLPGQVTHLAEWLTEHDIARVHLVGHSVGGAVALLFAEAYPERVASVISVEGNFSLADAFWSASVAQMTPVEAQAMLRAFQAEPGEWLAKSGIVDEPRYREIALELLGNQPASTLQATARSIVDITGGEQYSTMAKAVFNGPITVHLLAGNCSRDSWQIPDWALEKAASVTCLPGGHLMMIENPELFVSTLASYSN